MKKKIAKPKSKASAREYAKLRKAKAMKKLQKETTLAFIANTVALPDQLNQPDDIVWIAFCRAMRTLWVDTLNNPVSVDTAKLSTILKLKWVRSHALVSLVTAKTTVLLQRTRCERNHRSLSGGEFELWFLFEEHRRSCGPENWDADVVADFVGFGGHEAGLANDGFGATASERLAESF
jgi:hypothetical protein